MLIVPSFVDGRWGKLHRRCLEMTVAFQAAAFDAAAVEDVLGLDGATLYILASGHPTHDAQTDTAGLDASGSGLRQGQPGRSGN